MTRGKQAYKRMQISTSLIIQYVFIGQWPSFLMLISINYCEPALASEQAL